VGARKGFQFHLAFIFWMMFKYKFSKVSIIKSSIFLLALIGSKKGISISFSFHILDSVQIRIFKVMSRGV